MFKLFLARYKLANCYLSGKIVIRTDMKEQTLILFILSEQHILEFDFGDLIFLVVGYDG